MNESINYALLTIQYNIEDLLFWWKTLDITTKGDILTVIVGIITFIIILRIKSY